jgi:hypothetical protein
MKRLRGDILENGRVILPGTDLFLHAGWEDGRPWDGYFLLPPGRFLNPGRGHRLVLDDGRAGEIMLKTTHFNARAETPVLFKLTGGLAYGTL